MPANVMNLQAEQKALSDAKLIRQVGYAVRSQMTKYVVGGPNPPSNLNKIVLHAFRGFYANRVSLKRLCKYAKKQQGEVWQRYVEMETKLQELQIDDVFDGLCKRLVNRDGAPSSRDVDESTLRNALMSDPLPEEREMRESLLHFLLFTAQKVGTADLLQE